VTANKPVSPTVLWHWCLGDRKSVRPVKPVALRTYLPQVLLCNKCNKKAEWEPANPVLPKIGRENEGEEEVPWFSWCSAFSYFSNVLFFVIK